MGSKSKISNRIVLLLFIILILGAVKQKLWAQSYNFEVQTIPLKGEFINFSGKCIMQDSEGFMWLGSTEGLYRYHGTGVKVYRHIPNDENSLSDNFIMDLYEDSEGVIWIGTKRGLNRFDKYTETFMFYESRKGDSTSITEGEINKIAEDRNGNLWIANDGGFNRLDRRTETFKNYRLFRDSDAPIKRPYQIFDLIPDREYLWLTTGNGLYRFTIPSENLEKITEAILPFVMNVFIDRSERYWLRCHKGILLLDPMELTCKPFPNQPGNSRKITDQYIRTMMEDGSGNIWIRSLEGIYCYNQALELKYFLEHSYTYPQNYASQEMTKEMFMDNTGAIWFYSPEGINQIRNIKQNFKIYSTDTTLQTWVKCIYPESKDRVWFGTLQGIHRLDRNENLIDLIYGNRIWVQGFPHSANTMFLDSESTLWIGMVTEGLLSMITSGEGEVSFRKHWPVNVDSSRIEEFGFYDINHLFEDPGGRLWVGCRKKFALQYYDREKNRMIRLVNNPAYTDRLPEKAAIRHITGTDTLWAIGSSGIYKIIQPIERISEDEAIATNIIQCRLLDGKGNYVKLKSITITHIDDSGDIWLGSAGGGLFRVSRKKSSSLKVNEYRVKNYNTLLGLPGNQVLSILPDEKGNLWMGTNNGLTKFNPVSETFTNYYVRHGLPVNEFIFNSAAMDKNGEMYFGTLAGLVSFYPDSILINRNKPPVRITDIKINNQILRPGNNTEFEKAITFADYIELNHNQDNLSIEYAILNFDNPELNQYRYILEGFNEDWIYAGNRTFAEYTNLDPGRYIFRVLGSNNDGIWNDEAASFGITILPPPWQTWYAYIIYGIIVSGFILWYRNYLRNRAKLRMAVQVEKIEKKKIQEIDLMKSRFFANISHEFRTPLTLISGPLADLDKQDTENISLKRDILGIMKRNTERLQKLINQLLDISKMETGTVKLQVSEGKMETFLRTIILSFLSLAESKKIKYSYQLPGSDLSLWYDADKLEKILVNLISNAFKFTNEYGKINIFGEYLKNEGTGAPQYLALKIEDTGMGIPSDRIDRIFDRFYKVSESSGSETEGAGIGLALTKELVELYRGEIKVTSIEGEGTTFKLKIPVARDYFREDERIIQSEENPETVKVESYEPSGIRSDTTVDNAEEKNKPLILIVEDNPDLTHYITGNLEKQYRIISAWNGKQGFELTVEHIPDLVVSDLMMPVMDGLEMCGLIREDERTSHIPVIMLTARADRDSKMEGLQTGADDYLIKPFDAQELQVRVKNLIQQRQKLREKFRKELITEPEGTPSVSPEDVLLKKIMEICYQHMADSDFNIDRMSDSLNMSRTQLYRKVHSITGYAPMELLQTIRLKKAAFLLESGEGNISQVAYQVGFNNMSYFAKCYRRLYKENPSEHIKSRK